MTILEKVKDTLSKGKYPIIHLEKDNFKCQMCMQIDNNYLQQCRHFIIVTDLYDGGFIGRIITSSPNYGNIKIVKEQYHIDTNIKNLGMFFKPLKYHSNLIHQYFFTSDCMEEGSYRGYFDYVLNSQLT
jgi:hypothetical protein